MNITDNPYETNDLQELTNRVENMHENDLRIFSKKVGVTESNTNYDMRRGIIETFKKSSYALDPLKRPTAIQFNVDWTDPKIKALFSK